MERIGHLLDQVDQLGRENRVPELRALSGKLRKLRALLKHMPVDRVDYAILRSAMERIGYDLDQYRGLLAGGRTAEWDQAYRGRVPKAKTLWATQKPDRILTRFYDQRPRTVPSRALDLGCGDGTNAVYMASHGTQVVGVDISQPALAQARKKARAARKELSTRRREAFQCELVEGSIFDVPTASDAGTFDLVLDRGCLHHIPIHLFATYRERVHASLRDGGHFILLVHAPTWRLSYALVDACVGPVQGLLSYMLWGISQTIFSVGIMRSIFESHFDFETLSVEVDPFEAFHSDVVGVMRKKSPKVRRKLRR